MQNKNIMQNVFTIQYCWHPESFLNKGWFRKKQNVSPLSRASGHLGIKVRTFWNSSGNAKFENILLFNDSFNINWDKAKTVESMICRLALIKNKYIGYFLRYTSIWGHSSFISESIHIKLAFLTDDSSLFCKTF